MKRLRMYMALSALAFILTAPAFAADRPAAPAAPPAKDAQAGFEKRKAAALERIDRRISALQDLRGCVAAANSREDMEKCREKLKGERGEKGGK